jgi:hypothetical protein
MKAIFFNTHSQEIFSLEYDWNNVLVNGSWVPLQTYFANNPVRLFRIDY